MRNYIVASHGPLAGAIVETMSIIVPRKDNIYTVCAYMDETDPKETIDKLIKELQPKGELIIFTDIFGGSVNNIMMQYLTLDNIYLFSGVNLPLLMNTVLSEGVDIKTLVEDIKQNRESTIIYCNDKFKEETEEEDF